MAYKIKEIVSFCIVNRALKCRIFNFCQRVSREPFDGKTWFQSHIVEQLESYPMVVEIQGTKTCHFSRAALFRSLADGVHKKVHRGAHGCLQVIGLGP